ncbi:MAG: hypothetical protein ACREQ5_04305 [Candidatus Dormibacteria bacterium]
MANVVYADPFGSIAKGRQLGIANFKNIAETARDLQARDLNNEFAKWYLPEREAQTQNTIGQQLFQQAVKTAQTTGDYSSANRIAEMYLGANTTHSPNTGLTPAQNKTYDFASGNLPYAFKYPDVVGTTYGGGVYRQASPFLNPRNQAEYETLQIEAAKRNLEAGNPLSAYKIYDPSAITGLGHNAATSVVPIPAKAPSTSVVPIPAKAPSTSNNPQGSLYQTPHPSDLIGRTREELSSSEPAGIFSTPGEHAHPSVADLYMQMPFLL